MSRTISYQILLLRHNQLKLNQFMFLETLSIVFWKTIIFHSIWFDHSKMIFGSWIIHYNYIKGLYRKQGVPLNLIVQKVILRIFILHHHPGQTNATLLSSKYFLINVLLCVLLSYQPVSRLIYRGPKLGFSDLHRVEPRCQFASALSSLKYQIN